MTFRKALITDYENLKALFGEVIKNLDSRNIHIWDDVFPVCCLEEDIAEERLFVLSDGDKLISVFALIKDDGNKGHIIWEKSDADAMYLYRLAVSPDYYNKGIGSLMLGESERLTREAGGEYLRLYVADCNAPAIKFYEKHGYRRGDGEIKKEEFDFLLFGYEIKV